METFVLGDITIEVEQKDIKNIHLSVYPPDGHVRIAAPNNLELDTIRIFAINKLKWIKSQIKTFQNQDRETQREYISKESHYYLGDRYLLEINEGAMMNGIERKHKKLVMTLKAGTAPEKRKEILEKWYRQQMKSILPELFSKWEKVVGVEHSSFGIRKMKTKWGSCNTETGRILLNLELAKKPIECVEYILVHELVHLHERKHNDRFVALMSTYLPDWRVRRDELNRLPFRHLDWKY